MAITAATMKSDFASGFFTVEQTGYIFERAARQSVVQRLATRVPLGPSGTAIPIVTGKVSAGWVSEGATKPATKAAINLKTIQPYKLGAIAVVSQEVVRENPGNYTNLIRDQMAEAFAIAFDMAALHDRGPDGTAGAGPFSTYIDQTANAVEIGTTTQAAGGIHGDLVAGLRLLVNNDKLLTGFGVDNRMEPLLWGAVDSTGRPLYTALPTDDTSQALARPGSLLGRPAWMGQGVWESGTKVMAYGGDWSQAVWGAIGQITYALSSEAAVTINGVLVSTFENNLVAIRAEAEYGFLMNDPLSFVKYVDALP